MFKYINLSRWCHTFAISVLSTTLIMTTSAISAIAQNSIVSNHTISPINNEKMSQTDTDTDHNYEQTDPLNSPYPIPWEWVMKTYTELVGNGKTGTRYYRGPSLISPDGQYAVYSRIQVEILPELYRSRVSSVMFLENITNGELKTITASSPLADNPFNNQEESDMPGAISILIPVSWSPDGNRLLARQFEGLFSTSDASDYAVIWDRKQNSAITIAPQRIQYSNAVLLGWSPNGSDTVLFRAGTLGDEYWPVWSVDIRGDTKSAERDQPRIFGQVVTQVWGGPQTD